MKAKKKLKKGWVVYIIETERKTLYTGITNDLKKRFEAHRQGKGAKFFRMQRPTKVVYIEKLQNKSKALRREHVIKCLSSLQKRKLCQNLTSKK